MKKLLVLSLLCTMMTGGWAKNDEGVPFNGVVTDLLNNPLRGVRVWVNDEECYALSDRKGHFGLTDVMPDDTLRLRFRKKIYFIPVAGRKGLRVRLGDQWNCEEDLTLSDLGYGFVRTRERTTPSSGISGDELRRTGKTDLLEALVGKVAGLSIVGEMVYIRGIGTNQSYVSPLYVVDGMIVPNLYVDVSLVDHVEVLKDASIYGAQGAHGAIVVTLRK